MTLIGRIWAAVTTFVNIITISPVSPISSISPVAPWDDIQKPLPPSPPSGPDDHALGYPSFTPPSHAHHNFKCEYPAMKGWEDCSHDLDRKCWIRRVSDGLQFDINTDYENITSHGVKLRGVDRYYNLDLADGSYDADGLNFPYAKLFNKTYPGPWIEACWGDRLIINVTNSLKQNGTSVHWHGIRQLGTSHMDGVNGVTQCPIAPGDYFVYNFTLTQYGSTWYHSHYSVQYADGSAGPITIHGPSSGDWDEAINPPLILSDWYHNSAFSVVAGGETGGKDILVNGRGNITRFSGAKNTTAIRPPLNITFESPRPGQGCKKYLLRVINTSFDTTFVFSIDNHLLQVVTADFVPIQPYRNTSILIGIGQRYNVVVEANPLNRSSPIASDGNYWIRTEIADCFVNSDPGNPGYDQVAVLRYNASSTSDPTTKKWDDIALKCSDETYTSLNPVYPWIVKPPSNGDLNFAAPGFGQDFSVFFEGPRDPIDYPLAKFTMDNVSRAAPIRVNYSDPTFLHLDPKSNTTWPELWRVQPENYHNSEWIYLVLHGNDTGGSHTTGRAHPIHLHGHDFAILEQVANQTWDPYNMNLKLVNPPRRDVVLLPADGYVVIAFKADNPGPWLVHCHIAFHISWGLGMQIMEDQAGAFRLWPDKNPAITEAERVCTNWRKWYSDTNNWAENPSKCNNTDWCFQNDAGV